LKDSFIFLFFLVLGFCVRVFAGRASKRRRRAAAAATAIKDANTIRTAQKFSAAILPLVLGPLANTVAAGQLSNI
jgi:hypothetical protein